MKKKSKLNRKKSITKAARATKATRTSQVVKVKRVPARQVAAAQTEPVVQPLLSPELVAQAKKVIRKPEVRLGLIFLVVLILGLAVVAAQAIRKMAHNPSTQTDISQYNTESLITALPSPVIMNASPSANGVAIAGASASPTSVATAAAAPKPTAAPATSATIAVRVRPGDSFWRIAQRVCGNGKLATKLQRQLKYTHRTLQAGTVLQIKCN